MCAGVGGVEPPHVHERNGAVARRVHPRFDEREQEGDVQLNAGGFQGRELGKKQAGDIG